LLAYIKKKMMMLLKIKKFFHEYFIINRENVYKYPLGCTYPIPMIFSLKKIIK